MITTRIVRTLLMLVHCMCTQLDNVSVVLAITSASGDRNGNKYSESLCAIYNAYHGPWSQMKCTGNTPQLNIGYCITVDKNRTIFAIKCPYFQIEGHSVSDPGCIKLPDNISELNDYMHVWTNEQERLSL